MCGNAYILNAHGGCGRWLEHDYRNRKVGRKHVEFLRLADIDGALTRVFADAHASAHTQQFGNRHVVLAESKVVHHGVAVQVLALQDAFKLGTHLLLCHRLIHRHAADRLDEIRAVLDRRSDDEEDEYEHYEKLVTTRILVGLDLETLNHYLVCYGCEPERRRRVAAKE